MERATHIKVGILFFVGLLIAGCVGYMLIEGWYFLDALYMTVITLSTVGYREVHSLTASGMIFTMTLILVGVGFIFYIAGNFIQFMVEGQIREILERRKLKKKIQSLRDHYIICGYGRVGRVVARELLTKPVKIVVIERDPNKIQNLEDEAIPYVRGEATDEANLLRAGIRHAQGLVAAMGADVDNVYITLSARGLNPDLFIMARGNKEGSEKKLLQAGADKVVCPHKIGAQRMAHGILRPTVTDFLELAMINKGRDIQMEEIPVASSSKLIGVALQDSGIRKDLDLIVIAIKRASGEMLFNPSSQAQIQAGDTVIAVGENKNLIRLEEILNPCGVNET
nr:potassium channel protein [Desulfobacterales bacterium]